MQARDFCYWLKGFLELKAEGSQADNGLTFAQTKTIEKHLDLVFVHEIDPSMGGPDHQKKLNTIHGANTAIMRC